MNAATMATAPNTPKERGLGSGGSSPDRSAIVLTLLMLVCALLTLLGVALVLAYLDRLQHDLRRTDVACEERAADQQIRQLTWAAMQRMLSEARQSQERSR
jgi:hypothetical protein